ncbi:MAG: PHP domain-containing protein [Clostridia bacterium]|nr:PHP domain-containing protein [Clostridia bacterium]
MKIIAELHTHSNEYCDHAYSSIDEEVATAKEKGIKFFATTNHGPMHDKGTPVSFYMGNRRRKYEDITFLAGVEADIRDLKGGLDFAATDLLRLDFVIASLHEAAIKYKYPDYTESLVASAENPGVDCLGHIARDLRYNYDPIPVLKAVKENRKLIEFNNWSMLGYEKFESCGKIMDLCKEMEIECVVTSDAHDTERIGKFSHVIKMLEERNFPEELIINADEERMASFLARRKEEKERARAALFNL